MCASGFGTFAACGLLLASTTKTKINKDKTKDALTKLQYVNEESFGYK